MEKLGSLDGFPLHTTVISVLLPLSVQNCQKDRGAPSPPHPPFPQPDPGEERGSPRADPGRSPHCPSLSATGVSSWEPTREFNHKYLLVIVNTASQGCVVFSSFFFFRFYILDSLRFHSQNRFYPNKGFYYYYSPVITQH